MITYICAMCGGEFKKVPGQDDKAVAEFAKLYPGLDIKQTGIVCDECFKQLDL